MAVRTSNPRFRNLIASLVLQEKVVTTEARAKALKSEMERLISRSKTLDLRARRRIIGLMPTKKAATKLLEQIVPQFKDREGGYVRVIKLPKRRGDNAPMARVEFVEMIGKPKEEKESSKKKKEGKPKTSKKKEPKKKKSNKGSGSK